MLILFIYLLFEACRVEAERMTRCLTWNDVGAYVISSGSDQPEFTHESAKNLMRALDAAVKGY